VIEGQNILEIPLETSGAISKTVIIKEKEIYFGGILDAKYHGPAQIFTPQMKITFEGEFEIGSWSGYGREYNPKTGNLIQEGIYKGCLEDPNGKIYDSLTRKLLYEGNIVRGAIKGPGVFYHPLTGEVIQVQADQENKDCLGVIMNYQSINIGKLQNGKLNGPGETIQGGRKVFEGIFEQG
jgi:hypothetical protein